MTINALIIEDEVPARQTLRSYLNRYFPNVKIEAYSDTISESLRQLSEKKVDIIFLDVQLKDGLGIKVLKELGGKTPRVIFTTAHEDYTQEAFKHKAFGYLLKPLDPQDFKEIMNRVIKDIRYEDQAIHKIKVPSNKYGQIIIDVNQIVRCEAESNYTKIITEKNENYILSKTLKYVEEEMLPEGLFIRPHQSHLVNIDKIIKNIVNSTSLTLINGDKIPISRSRKDAIKAVLAKRGIELL